MYTEEYIINCIKNKEQLKANIEYKRAHLVDYLTELESVKDSIYLSGFRTTEYVQGSGYKKDMVFESIKKIDAAEIDKRILGVSNKLNELITEEMKINRIWICYIRLQELAPLHFYTVNKLWYLKDSKYGVIAKELCVAKNTISIMLHNAVRAIQALASSDITDELIVTTSINTIKTYVPDNVISVLNNIEKK